MRPALRDAVSARQSSRGTGRKRFDYNPDPWRFKRKWLSFRYMGGSVRRTVVLVVMAVGSMSLIHRFFAGLRATSWVKLMRDIAAIGLVLGTPHAVHAVYRGLQLDLTQTQYLNAVYFVSPLVAIFMVFVLHYRVYRAGRA